MQTSVYFIGFAIAFLLTLLITPLTIRLAHYIGAIDYPNSRKVHQTPTPRLGGLAIAISVFLTVAFLWMWDSSVAEAINSRLHIIPGVVIGILIILILGIIDDVEPISAGIKFLVQTLAAIIVVLSGLNISAITIPLTGTFIELGWVAWPLSVLWILAITNAVNLIDGLDGLASGIAAIAALTIAFVSILNAHFTVAAVLFAVAGTLLGFLKYNYPPAKIFLGDSGSLLLGFILSLGAMQASVKSPAAFALVVGVSILALPILDTSVAMLRRFLKPWLPGTTEEQPVSMKQCLKSIFLPDKSHIHHRLLARGWSHKKSVHTLYLISTIFAVCAVLLAWSNSFNISFLLIAFATMYAWAVIRKMQCWEIAVFSNGLLLHQLVAPFTNRKTWQHIIDGIAFLAAMLTGWYLISPESELILISAITLVQFGAFKGLRYFYHEPYRNIGIGDALSVVKSILISALIGWIVFVAASGNLSTNSMLFFTWGFYIATTLILGSRLGFDILFYLYKKNQPGSKKLLIYGTGNTAMLALSQLLEHNDSKTQPVGFLDDNPEKEGVILNGFPVYGGHWKLPRLIQTRPIDEILITDPNILPEVAHRIDRIAKKHNISIRVLNWQLQRIPFNSQKVDTPDLPEVPAAK